MPSNASMRIIAGIHRGRTILAPEGQRQTRPITDRVKEALFNRLMARDLTGGGRVLDVFSGTGSLGLETLSRGADHCTFVEQHSGARRRLEENLRTLDLTDQSKVLGVDALAGAATGPAWLRSIEPGSIRVAFCDPPYRVTADPRGLQDVLALVAAVAPVMEPDGMLTLRTDADVAPTPVAGWEGPETKTYGTMGVHLYVRETPMDAEASGAD